ncbi:MAG: hypothetical protein J0H15_10765 [Xanthomonadales bacterium]|nr:hypothetical protein [Xanthomonadales bacterium]
MNAKDKPKLTLIDGGRESLCRQIVEDLLAFRTAEVRAKCDILRSRGQLQVVPPKADPISPWRRRRWTADS